MQIGASAPRLDMQRDSEYGSARAANRHIFLNFFDLTADTLAGYLEQSSEFDGTWFFHHIPKTAGSSLAAELAQRAAPYRNLHIDYTDASENYADKIERAVTLFLAEKANLRSASGHVQARHIERIAAAEPRLRFFTFFRHPVQRVLSEYHYSRSPLHPPHEEFRRRYPTLGDYLDDPREANKMAQYLFAEMPATPEEAKAALAGRYAMIGLQERYPVSFVMLTTMLGGPALPKARERVLATGKTPPDPETFRRVVAANRMDLALYTMVQNVYARIASAIWAASDIPRASDAGA